MGTDTPNKRKSSSNADKTPNKIQKLSRTSVSKTVKNKSPKAAIKVNQKQIHGNKSAKSPNKSQKNVKQVTPKGGKKTKQTEKIISDNESDDSMDELNENNDNSSDATHEEVDSNEDAEVAEEADSEDEAEMKEEVDSNLKIIMGTNTPNKRKSSSNANKTLNKIQKLSRTSVSKTVKDKSLKAAIKVNQKQIHGNKSAKSPNKNQKSGKQVTPKGGKKTKQTEKIISDDESDDSMDELNENNDNSSDATDEEVYSNEDADIADSEDEAEMEEEVDSNEEQVDEEEADESDQESDSTDEFKEDADETKNNCQVSSYSVFVTGLKPEVYFNAVFPGCNLKFCRLLRDSNSLFTGEGFAVFRDQESMTKALAKDKTKFDGSVIRVKAKVFFCVKVFGIDENTNLSKIFHRCNIISSYKLSKHGYVYFEDKKSLEIALENKQIKDNGRIITVQDALNIKNINLLVTGLEPHENIHNIFPECSIRKVKIMRHPVTNELTGTANLTVANEESVKKALEKNGTKCGNSILTVEPFNPDKFIAIHKELRRSEKKEDADETKNNHFHTFAVIVTGLNSRVDCNKIFPVRNIKFFRLFMDENYLLTVVAYIVFKDQASMTEALAKDKSEFDGSVIRVKATFSVNVFGIDEYTNFSQIFPRCNIISSFKCTDYKKLTGRAFVYFEDKESQEIALEKEQINDNGRILKVAEDITDPNFKLIVEGMKPGDNINDIFPECSIRSFYLCRHPHTKELTGKAILNVTDEESVQKALLKNGTVYGGHEITVIRKDCCVHVIGLNADSEIENFFKHCKIQRIDLIKNKSTNEFSGMAIVHFKDKESFEYALWKNNTKLGDRTVTVLECKRQTLKQSFESFEKAISKNSRRVQVYRKQKPNSRRNKSYLKPNRKSFDSRNKIAYFKTKKFVPESKPKHDN